MLIATLENDSDSDVRQCAITSLGKIGDSRAVEVLIDTLKNDSDYTLREWAAISLACFEGRYIDRILETARDRKNVAAAISLAWRRGSKDVEFANRIKIKKYYLQLFFADARARWGNPAAVEKIIDDLFRPRLEFKNYHSEVFLSMPKNIPEFDFKANYATRKKQAEAMKVWYKKYNHRLAWNPETKKYYLKPEKNHGQTEESTDNKKKQEAEK